jgi:hypothetical protein
MPKRRADADHRRFTDEFPSVRVSRFRANGTIDPAKREAVIPFPDGSTKLIGVGHTHLKYGGGWSFFTCPGCAKLAQTLYSIDDRPLCWRCCDAMNIKHRSRYGFGRQERMRAADLHLDQLIAKLETTEPLRLNGAPASQSRRQHNGAHGDPSDYPALVYASAQGGKAKLVYRSHRLTRRMRRSMIVLRLSQLATQNASGSWAQSYTPSAATKQLIDFGPIRRARTPETLERALDQAQDIILTALQSNDPQTRLTAARLMLKTRAARQRGLA